MGTSEVVAILVALIGVGGAIASALIMRGKNGTASQSMADGQTSANQNTTSHRQLKQAAPKAGELKNPFQSIETGTSGLADAKDFEAAVQETFRVAVERGYEPRYLMNLVESQGSAVKATKTLLRKRGQPQTGLMRLRDLHLLHMSMENLSLQDCFAHLFDAADKKEAIERLRSIGGDKQEIGEWKAASGAVEVVS